MSVPEIKLNGRNWLTKGLLQVLIILALVIYIGVKEISSGDGKAGKEASTAVNERIARIEECIISLRPLPAEVAGMKATLDGVKSKVDNIDRKLESHIERTK